MILPWPVEFFKQMLERLWLHRKPDRGARWKRSLTNQRALNANGSKQFGQIPTEWALSEWEAQNSIYHKAATQSFKRQNNPTAEDLAQIQIPICRSASTSLQSWNSTGFSIVTAKNFDLLHEAHMFAHRLVVPLSSSCSSFKLRALHSLNNSGCYSSNPVCFELPKFGISKAINN